MGRLLGERYQVVHPVWRDRLGETYVARDRQTGYPVTVRVLRGDLAAGAVARRFHEERQRLTALRHPGLAGVVDLTEDRDVLGIVSEVVEGPTLRQRLRGRAPTSAEVARIGGGVAAGLEALHEAGLLHQNLGPDNVILTPRGTVRLTDIAVAHLLTAAPAARRRLPASAPELADGGAPTPASDLYALGTLLHELTRHSWSVPLRGLVRQLRARDPRGRPTAHQARMRLCPNDGRQDDDTLVRLPGIKSAGHVPANNTVGRVVGGWVTSRSPEVPVGRARTSPEDPWDAR